MPWSAELAILSSRGDLAQHVLVEVSLGVCIGHFDTVQLIDHVGEYPWGRHDEDGILHVLGVGRVGFALLSILQAQVLDEREDLILDRVVHLLRSSFLETRPAQVVLLVGKDWLFDRFVDPGSLAFLEGVQFIDALDE